MTLIIVSELHKVKSPKRFARMPSTETGAKTPANKRAGADPHPYLKESLPVRARSTKVMPLGIVFVESVMLSVALVLVSASYGSIG